MRRLKTTLLLIVAFLGRTVLSETQPLLFALKSDLDTFHTFTSQDSSSYKTLTLESETGTLYIGGRDIIFGRKSDDITKEAFSPVLWPVQKNSCKTLPQSDEGRKCYNQIQIVQPLNVTHVLICGSNSLSPRNKLLVKEGRQYSLIEDHVISGNTLCSFDPTDSVTSLVTRSLGGANVFSTARPEIMSKMSLVKMMPKGLLIPQDGMRGDKSTFVSSFTAMDREMSKVYIVSDEKTEETKMPGPAPTITQVCANDIGGENLLQDTWTSLLRVRLSCQTTDSYPLKFDLVTDLVPGRDGIVYGTFTTRHVTSRSNAVCSFRLADIQKAFSSDLFWETRTKQHTKVTAPEGNLRPGSCAPNGSTSKSFTSEFLSFMSKHDLVVEVVKPAYRSSGNETRTTASTGPLLIKPGEKFTKIVIEQVSGIDGATHDLIFVGKANGQILKFITIEKGDSVETIELAQYQLASLPIVSMTLSQGLGQLYVGTDDGVHQLSTSNCAAYTRSCKFCDPCRMCILSRDPGCAWDKSAKRCVSVRDRKGDNSLLQDVYHGNVQAQCGDYEASSTKLVKVSDGGNQLLGHIITNPAIIARWFKVEDSTTEKRIFDEVGKYRITSDGQLEIADFNDTQHAAVYEARYMAGTSLMSVSTYSVRSTTYVVPVISVTTGLTASTSLLALTGFTSVSPRVEPERTSFKRTLLPRTTWAGGTDPVDTSENLTLGTTDEPEKTIAAPINSASSIGIAIGLSVFLAIVLILAGVMLCRRRRLKHSTENEKYDLALENGTPPSMANNTTSNNNSQILRVQSEFDDRVNRPLITSRQDYSDRDIESNHLELPTSSHRNTKSLDNILDGDDQTPFIDDDTASDKGPVRQHSMRNDRVRQRKPPARTKSMPGSSFYVVYAGKKLMCSSLQRNRQGTWTVKLKPNQSGMSDMPSELDEVIDILNDESTDGRDRSGSFDVANPKASDMKVAREEFFKRDINRKPGSNGSPDGTVQFATSTPNNVGVASKPMIAPKPPHLLPTSPKRGQSDRRSAEASFGRNSSEDRDSDSTVKGSNLTLKPEETPPSANCTVAPHRHRHHNHQHNHDTQDVAAEVQTSDAPILAVTPNKKSRKKSWKLSAGSNQRSSDGSSGSSDGDDHLHGRDKGVNRKNRSALLDSPSKQSRTSQGSSSSAEYRSARSSVISSEPSQEQR